MYDDEPIPDPPAEPITARGDVWTLGEHRVMCGDSFADADRARLLDGETVAMVLTDPPYAIYGSSTGISASIADDRMVRPFFTQMWRAVAGVLPMFGHAYVHCDWRSWSSLWETARGLDLVFKNMLVWDKGGQGLGSMYAQTHELLAFIVREPPQKAMTSGKPTGQRMIHRPNMLRFQRPHGDERLHNAAKPVDMLAELIGNSSDEHDVVLDMFAGSGSTLIAAGRLGRRCYAMEQDPATVDVICARAQRVLGLVPHRDGQPVEFTPAGT